MPQILLVLTNLPDEASAAQIARALVQQRVAACVNVLPGVRSVYHWQGTVEEAAEFTLLVKTTQTCYSEVESTIRDMHPYDLPEIVAVPVTSGLPGYLEWVATETRKDTHV